VLAGEQAMTYKAAHFTWQVRRQLATILGGADKVETGGYKVITTLDTKAQDLAEKWLTAGAIVPNLSRKKGDALMKSLKIPKSDRAWVRALRGKDLHNGRTGRARLPERATCSPTRERRLLPRRPHQRQVLAEVRRGGRRVAPAGLGRSSRSSTPPPSTLAN
jgi:membrane carboxypeptidase/penicillin-binding protein